MMNKEKNPAVHVARNLVLVPLLATLAFTACHERMDVALPSTATASVDEIRVEEVIPNRVASVDEIRVEEVIPNRVASVDEIRAEEVIPNRIVED